MLELIVVHGHAGYAPRHARNVAWLHRHACPARSSSGTVCPTHVFECIWHDRRPDARDRRLDAGTLTPPNDNDRRVFGGRLVQQSGAQAGT